MIDFRPSAGPTLGVEWELALVDGDTLDLVPRADDVVAGVAEALDDEHVSARVHRELLSNTVEIVTGICDDVPQVSAEEKAWLDSLDWKDSPR